MANISFRISHIGTCLPCYLQDHHNRENEILVAVAVDIDSSNVEVFEGVKEEIQGFDLYGKDLLGLSQDDFDKELSSAVDSELSWLTEDGASDKLFDESLDKDGEDGEDGEEVYAYFLVTWEGDRTVDEDKSPEVAVPDVFDKDNFAGPFDSMAEATEHMRDMAGHGKCLMVIREGKYWINDNCDPDTGKDWAKSKRPQGSWVIEV